MRIPTDTTRGERPVRGTAAVRRIAPVALAVLVAGCEHIEPRVEVREPTTVVPVAVVAPRPADGAIFQAASYNPLFEDRRPRRPGDTLTVMINEKLSAAKKSSSSANRDSSIGFEVTAMNKLPLSKALKSAQLDAASKNNLDAKGEASSDNVFTGTITVTVVDVLPNGNLAIAGDKRIGVAHNLEMIRFSGVVNPIHINVGNTVSSTQVADARLEFRGMGYIDEAQRMSWLSRFFQTFLPF